MVLELNLHAMAGKPWDRTGPLLRELVRATGSHFALEEALMQTADYPSATIHRLRHEWLIDQVRVLLARGREFGLAANEPLLELLSDSHLVHMHTDDLRFGLWLNAAPDR
jgi:hemerythrin-like metal-binding protein